MWRFSNGRVDDLNTASPKTQVLSNLSPREKEVLSFASSGYSDKKISGEMGISLNTLRTYWQRIRHKLGDESRSALAVAYVEFVRSDPGVGYVSEMVKADSPEDSWSGVYRSHLSEKRLVHEVHEEITWDELQQRLEEQDRMSLGQFLDFVKESHEVSFSLSRRRISPRKAVEEFHYQIDIGRENNGSPTSITVKPTKAIEVGLPLVAALQTGCWTTSWDTSTLEVDSGFRTIFRLPDESDVIDFANGIPHVHPEDRELFAQTLSDIRNLNRNCGRLTHRLLFEDDSVSWVTHDIRASKDGIFGTVIFYL